MLTMKKNILIFCCLFLTHSLFAQTVIKTQTNKGKTKKVIVKRNKKNSKKIIIKDNHQNYSHSHHDKIIVKSNRDRLVINRPERPKKLIKKYKKKRRGFVWVKGFWKWSPIFRRYLWQEGHWIKKRRNYHWHDGYWEETMRGFFWVKGFWCNQL